MEHGLSITTGRNSNEKLNFGDSPPLPENGSRQRLVGSMDNNHIVDQEIHHVTDSANFPPFTFPGIPDFLRLTI